MTVFIVIAFAQGIEARARAIGNVLAIGCAVIVASIFVINDVYKWRMREPLYAQSDIIVHSRDEPHEAIVDEKGCCQ